MSYWLGKRPDAEPLGDSELEEAKQEDWLELVVELDGEKYNSEDLYACDGCENWHVSASELEEGFCPECIIEGEEEAEHQRQLRSDYYASVL